MDLDPFVPVGIGAPAMRLLDVFLLHCLLADSPPDTPDEIAANGRNQQRIAARGREPGLRLERDGREVALADWGEQLLDECAPIAATLDAAHGGQAHRDALAAALAGWRDPATLPSARVLDAMRRDHGGSYLGFTKAQSRTARQTLLEAPLDGAADARLQALAQRSLDEQKRIEAADRVPFETYRLDYLSAQRLAG